MIWAKGSIRLNLPNFCAASWADDKTLFNVLTKIDIASLTDAKAFVAKFATDAHFRTAILADVRLVDVWRVTYKLDLVFLQNLKNKFIDIGYTNFDQIQPLKYDSGAIFYDKIYCETTTVEPIMLGSPKELPFLKEICIQYNTKAFSPKSIVLASIDGVLETSGRFIQLKTTNYKNRTALMNAAYDKAKASSIKELELYVELMDMTSDQCVQQWNRVASLAASPSSAVNLKNDGTLSKIINKGTDGIWVELDLNLLPK
ncbi:MAG: hypothetical protein RIS64_4013 [Bacteroidota bacterium]|jgi:hypothetical protein